MKHSQNPAGKCVLLAAAILLTGVADIFPQDTKVRILRIFVSDSKGDAVREATVEATSGGLPAVRCESSGAGEFDCKVPSGTVSTVSVSAPGFASLEFSAGSDEDTVNAVLRAGPVSGSVVVSASGNEGLLGETPASINVLDSAALSRTGAPTIDGALRQTVGFTLFRRSSSATSNPTTQGVSLRAVNASGASRSLVLFDSVPLNDPFGGWVRWNSVSRSGIERIEVLRGGASSLYGSDALGGAVNVVPRTARTPFAISVEAYGGSLGTASGDVFAGTSNRYFSGHLAASAFTTDGYIPVEMSSRGDADAPANSRHQNVSFRFSPVLGDSAKVFISGSYFDEDRQNGTRLQTNDTQMRRFSVGLDKVIGPFIPGSTDATVSIRSYAILQSYDQSFTAVSADRNSESLVRTQTVPSESFGIRADQTSNFESHSLRWGAEWAAVSGSSNESGFFSGRQTTLSGSGGREVSYGFHVQDIARIGDRLILLGRVRFDKWENRKGFNTVLSLSTGETLVEEFRDRKEDALSPAAAVLVKLSDRSSMFLSASRSFRAPTLNELYRGFRVGDVITSSNEALDAERSTNVEGGASFDSGVLYVRGSVFRTSISGAVANVTVEVTPDLILRQRQNAASVSVTGVEIESEVRSGRFSGSFGYLLARSVFDRFPSNEGLIGKDLPQSPLHQFTANILFEGPSATEISFQARGASGQFDDDLNELDLGSYFHVDALFSKRLGSGFRVFGAVENLLNSRYAIGLTPVRTVAQPFTLRAGIRFQLN